MTINTLSKHFFDLLMKQLNINDDNVFLREGSCFISINDANGTTEQPYFKLNHPNVLVQYFDDTEEDMEVPIIGTDEVKKVTAFTEEQAKQIIDFLEKNKHRSRCFIHCSAGISRSGAVGEFINGICGESYQDFKKRNPHIHPNGHVLKTLEKVSLLNR